VNIYTYIYIYIGGGRRCAYYSRRTRGRSWGQPPRRGAGRNISYRNWGKQKLLKSQRVTTWPMQNECRAGFCECHVTSCGHLHTRMHTRTHTHTHTYTHTWRRQMCGTISLPHIFALTDTCTHARTHPHTHSFSLSHTHTHTHTHAHTHTHTHTYTHTRRRQKYSTMSLPHIFASTHTHTHTHKHTHTHTHTAQADLWYSAFAVLPRAMRLCEQVKILQK